MLIPPRCFTCGKPIGHLYDKYLNDVQAIHQEQEASGKKSDATPQKIVLDRIGFTRYCCRRMFLCHQDFYNEIS